MEKTLTAEEIERRIRDRGLSVAQVCRAANINQATFQRWKNGSDPTLSTYNALVEAIDTLTSSKSAAE